MKRSAQGAPVSLDGSEDVGMVLSKRELKRQARIQASAVVGYSNSGGDGGGGGPTRGQEQQQQQQQQIQQSTILPPPAPPSTQDPLSIAPPPHVHHGSPQHAAERAALPMAKYRGAVCAALLRSRALVLTGETGSGKTTQLPQYLWEHGVLEALSKEEQQQLQQPAPSSTSLWKGPKALLVTQPRRVAAITLAKRVASECGTPDLVGHSVRFDDSTTPRTRIKFATDGTLLREAQVDPTLSRYSVIVLDEAHERSLATDVLFGVVYQAMVARPCLRAVVMSATLDVGLFASFFESLGGKGKGGGRVGNHLTPVTTLSVPGRQYHVDTFYMPSPPESYLDAALNTILQVADGKGGEAGDILVFLPGQEEIEDLAGLLTAQGKGMMEEREGGKAAPAPSAAAVAATEEATQPLKLRVCPLYAALSPEAQMEAFRSPPKGVRKVILATNIAETSLTINGVTVVVDCGKVKVKVHGTLESVAGGSGGYGRVPQPSAAQNKQQQQQQQPQQLSSPVLRAGPGIETLACVDVSQSSAAQRKGRAGRESPGQCYRLYTEEFFATLPANPTPEVHRTPLASTLLQLLGMGGGGMLVADLTAFPWLEAPPADALTRALHLLESLGAVGHLAVPPPPPPSTSTAAPASSTPVSGSSAAVGLTPFGKAMAALPLDPRLSSFLLRAAGSGGGVEALALVAILSSEGLWVMPGRGKEGELAAARAKFIVAEGDHLTALSAMGAFERVLAGAAKGKGGGGGEGKKVVTMLHKDIFEEEEEEEGKYRGGGKKGTSSSSSSSSSSSFSSSKAPTVAQLLGPWGGMEGSSSKTGSKGGGTQPPTPPSDLGFVSSFAYVRKYALAAAAAAVASTSATSGSSSSPPLLHPSQVVRAFLTRVNSEAGAWCREHFLSLRALKNAVMIRDQLASLAASPPVSLPTPFTSCSGRGDVLRRALLASCGIGGLARRQPGGGEAGGLQGGGGGRGGGGASYTIQGLPHPVYIHPSSVLVQVHAHVQNKLAAARAATAIRGGRGAAPAASAGGGDGLFGYPEVVVFTELVHTSRTFMRAITKVDTEWLQEGGGEWGGLWASPLG